MRTVVIVQARMGSTRLPGKVLMDLAGRPLLARVIERLRAARRIDEIVVATTDAPTDQAVAELAAREGVRCVQGPQDDVLTRYQQAAQQVHADVVVRVCGDCPLIDPEIVDRVITAFERGVGEYVYAANVEPRTFPLGLDVEVFSSQTLERLGKLAVSARAREHVTLLAREQAELFTHVTVEDLGDNSDLRWTVDVPEDLQMMRRLYEELQIGERPTPYPRILAFVREHPEIAAINAGVLQKVP
jgi:spore coat polysaccharide biosynthesis protein SpsF